jgi:hypothetical protein
MPAHEVRSVLCSDHPRSFVAARELHRDLLEERLDGE